MKMNTIVEFFGLPSSGKTTVSNALILLAENDGWTAENAFDYMYTTTSVTKRLVRYGRALLFSLCNIKNAKRIHTLHKKCFENKFVVISWDIYILNMLYCYKYRRRCEIEIYSQGIIQYLISLSVRNHQLNIDDLIVEFYDFLSEIRIVYIRSDVVTAVERMKNRTGYSYVEKSNNEETRLTEMTNLYVLCENFMAKLDNIISIEAMKMPDENAKIILEKINDYEVTK